MRVLILTFGTRGDVEPYVALARGLLDVGHDVGLCTAEGYRSLLVDGGVPYLRMGNEMLELIQQGMPTMAGPADALRLVRRMTSAMRSSLRDQWEAARDFAPEVLVYHPKALGGLHIAERLGIPAMVSLPLPFLTPTRTFPVPFIARWPFGGVANELSYELNRFTALAYGGMINSFRRSVLGLSSLSRWTDYLHDHDGRPIPVLYAFSSAVVPVPPDYPAHAHVTGFWFQQKLDSWRPPTALLDFLTDGDPLVYLGFGSMGFGRHAADRGRSVVDAIDQVGLRAVVATGWGGLKVSTSSPRIHVVDEVPHSWLFPKVAAVVHHGGSGTTAAGLRAGRPTLVCPVLGDQGFWAERVRRLRAGPAPLPVRRLQTDELATRLEDLVTAPGYLEQAGRLGRKLRAEDGVSAAVRVVEQVAATGG